jgi:NADH:ubiquinone oxidoreductase subunit 4 (subunit M)
MIQRIFAGPNKEAWKLPDLYAREMVIMLVMIALIAGLGLYPQPVLDAAASALESLQQQAGVSIRANSSIEDTNIAWQSPGYLWAAHPEPDGGGMP